MSFYIETHVEKKMLDKQISNQEKDLDMPNILDNYSVANRLLKNYPLFCNEAEKKLMLEKAFQNYITPVAISGVCFLIPIGHKWLCFGIFSDLLTIGVAYKEY